MTDIVERLEDYAKMVMPHYPYDLCSQAASEIRRQRAAAQSPSRDQIAKAVYEVEPFYEGGEYVDAFQVSPGGALSWEQAIARDAEFAPGKFMLPITKFAFDVADAVLALTSTQRNEDQL